jgi:hypothetical protein
MFNEASKAQKPNGQLKMAMLDCFIRLIPGPALILPAWTT